MTDLAQIDVVADAVCPSRDGDRVASRMLLQWHLTHRCNLRCRHCYQDAYEGRELDWRQKLAVVEQFRSLLAARRPTPACGQVTLTGGEPLSSEHFWPLAEHIRFAPQPLNLAVLTNGTLIDGATARRLAELCPRFVQVSVEGTQQTHDAIRGSGSFAAACNGLRELVAHGIRTSVSFTAHAGNYREFPAVVDLARRLRVHRVWADRLIPAGTADASGVRPLDPAETRAFFEIMRAARPGLVARRLRPTRVSMHRALQFLVAGGRAYRCTAGRSLLTLMPDGGLLPCRRMPIEVGNVLRTPLKELYVMNPTLRALQDRSRLPQDCRKCLHGPTCGGGLRCLAYAQTGDPHARDPGCWLR